MYSELGKDQREDSLGANLHRAANLGGKTQIVVREAEVDDMNRLTYGVFDNVDFRTESTEIEETTRFQQYSLSLEHAFNDDVRIDAVLGHSSSDYERPVFSPGQLRQLQPRRLRARHARQSRHAAHDLPVRAQ